MRWERLVADVLASLLVATLVALAVAAFAWAVGVMTDAVAGMLA